MAPEKGAFEVELTYNYVHEPYDLANGYSRLALEVKDLEGEHEKHKNAGFKVTDLMGLSDAEKPQYYFITDPDGYDIEIVRARKSLVRGFCYRKIGGNMLNLTNFKENLEKKGYEVSIFENKEKATEYILEEVNGKIIGFGGSTTLRQMELFDKLSKNNTVYWHGNKPEDLTPRETMLKAGHADVYFSSINGATINGELVNIDNTGNRVGAVAFGPEKIYLIIGKNKIEADIHSAIRRARNIAGPKNAQGLARKTPCAGKADKCYDCNSPERICRVLMVLWEKPVGAEYEIILIDEELGY